METVADPAAPEQVSWLSPAQADALRVILATLQAKHPVLADVLSRANAVLTSGRFFPGPNGTEALVEKREEDGTRTVYAVNGTCTCPAGTHHPEDVCKHRYALRLWQLLQAEVTKQAAPKVPTGIEARFIEHISGKPFIKFDGLLTIAKERGLEELTTTMVLVTSEMAVCQSLVRLKDGTSVTDIGDATPTNVKKHVAPHFVRMAATRAAARALRRALNIDLVAAEELGEDAA